MATEAAVMAGQVASQTSKLMGREEVAEGTMAFHFEKPSGFKFKAGQFADVTLIDPRNRNHTSSQHRGASSSRPPPAQVVSFLFQSAARRRTFLGHSAELGEDESQLPLDLHNDRNVEVQERMEGRGGCDRPRDAVQAF